MSFDTDGIYDLRDEFDRQAQAYEAAAASPMTTTASDASGSIEIELDQEAATIAVTIGNNWRSSYTADTLGAAIIATVSALGASRVAEWSTAVVENDEKPEPQTRPLPPESESLASALQRAAEVEDAPETTVVLDDILTLLEEVNAGLEAVSSIVKQRAAAVHSGSSAGGTATATVNGSGSPVSIEFEKDWLLNRSSYEISNAVTSAISRASAAARSAAPDNVLDGTPLAKYGSALNDPEAFARLVSGKD